MQIFTALWMVFTAFFLKSIHFTQYMVKKLKLLRKKEKCQEIFGFLSFMPFCGICTVIHSITIGIYRNLLIWTHFTWSKSMRLPIHTQVNKYKETFNFLVIHTFLEYWCSILEHHEQYLYNLLQQLPIYLL